MINSGQFGYLLKPSSRDSFNSAFTSGIIIAIFLNNKGVREHVELIKKMTMMMPDVKTELKESVEDGFKRYPNWPELIKISKWLEF